MRSRPARWTTLVAALILTLGVAGCASLSNPGQGSTGTQTPSGAAPTGQAQLARFYAQELSWQDCGGFSATPGTTCTWLTVPVDYADPNGQTLRLRVLKVPAEGGNAQGALLVNPGGPGGSAVEYAQLADFIVTPQVRRSFDIVGVDPRGVGHSEPITCVDAAGVDKLLGSDPTPDTAVEYDAMRATSKEFGDACAQKYPALLGHVSTIDAAKDMDVLRGVLGQPKLTYLGKSYGTFLGATYAGLFPGNVGRLVLDGAIAPDLTNDAINLGQAQGFETATRAYVQDCVQKGNCPLGGDLDTGMAALRNFLAEVDARPLPVTGDSRVKQLTEGWASTGLARAMYEQSLWDELTEALRQAEQGNGDGLFSLAGEYANRQQDGSYASNLMQVISAINCLDRGASPSTYEQMQAKRGQFAQQAPTWGPFMVWGSTTCQTWPVEPVGEPQQIAAAGSGPIVVVGTTRDPATPYRWAEQLAGQLQEGHLITYDGDGHTAYMRSNSCVDNAVDAYLLEGTVPKEGLRC